MYHRIFYVGLGTIFGAVATLGVIRFRKSAARLSLKRADKIEKTDPISTINKVDKTKKSKAK